jgi:HSP20 family protein
MADRPSTTSWEHPFELMRREFDSLFDRFFGSWPSLFEQGWMGGPGWGVDLEDTGTELVIRAEAPGFEAKDFDVQISGDLLTIQAERKEEGGKEEQRRWTRLHRTLSLPSGVDASKVEARYVNGILELHLPKTPEAQPRRIEVK